MMGRLFTRKPGGRDALFAEAQALVDDGLDPDFVLGLYPDDGAWLAPLLETSAIIGETFAIGEPSYYFEASLKSRFLAAARGKRQAQPVSLAERGRAALSAVTVMAGAGALAVLSLGFVTAGSAVPGDWNYTFKLANERMQYSLSRGNDRVNVQLSHTETRVQEITRLSSRGDISTADLEKLQREYADLKSQFEHAQQIDAAQRARVRSLAETSAALLADLRARQSDLDTAVATTQRTLDDTAAAAGVGTVTSVTPIATATPTAGPSATATVTGTPSPGPGATGTASPAETAEATATPPPPASATPKP